MREKEFRDYCMKRKLAEQEIELAISAVSEFEGHLRARGRAFESATVEDVKNYVSLLMVHGKNSPDRLSALARYSYVVKKNDFYVYFAGILGARNVLPTISDRVAAIAGEETRKRVFDGVELPPLGSPQEEYPAVTHSVMKRLERELSPEMCKKALAGNNHKIPAESLREERERFLELGSIDEFLEDLHRRMIAKLGGLMAEGRLFYEQEITPQVIDFVKGNQEILSGVRQGNKIYVTKFPYSPTQYLNETGPTMKRYYACHCPLVRAVIPKGEPNISPTWCYCSGGFEKFLFDVIFDEEVKVEVLESVLHGDLRCRFAIEIPEGKAKEYG